MVKDRKARIDRFLLIALACFIIPLFTLVFPILSNIIYSIAGIFAIILLILFLSHVEGLTKKNLSYFFITFMILYYLSSLITNAFGITSRSLFLMISIGVALPYFLLLAYNWIFFSKIHNISSNESYAILGTVLLPYIANAFVLFSIDRLTNIVPQSWRSIAGDLSLISLTFYAFSLIAILILPWIRKRLRATNIPPLLPSFIRALQSLMPPFRVLLLFLFDFIIVSFVFLDSDFSKYWFYLTAFLAAFNTWLIYLEYKNILVRVTNGIFCAALFFLLILIPLVKISPVFVVILLPLAVYLVFVMFFIGLLRLKDFTIELFGLVGSLLLLISVTLAYFFPLYTSALINVIYDSETVVFIATSLSLIGIIQVFNRISDKQTYPLGATILVSFALFVLSLFVIIFIKAGLPILKFTYVLISTSTQQVSLTFDGNAFINALAILLFLFGIIGLLRSVRDMRLLLEKT